MQRIWILPIAAAVLTLTACTPGTYYPRRGYYYPTPRNETVQPWVMPSVQPIHHSQQARQKVPPPRMTKHSTQARQKVPPPKITKQSSKAKSKADTKH